MREPDADDLFRLRFSQARDDVRSFATMLVQVVVLLLTTISLVIGWGAKDFVFEKYRIALRTAAPELSEQPATPPIPADTRGSELAAPGGTTQSNSGGKARSGTQAARASIESTQARVSRVGKVFQDLLMSSPTTSCILLLFAFFASALMGVLVILTYMLERRRILSHNWEERGGPPTQPVIDPVITTRSLTVLAGVLFVLAAGLYIAATLHGYGVVTSRGQSREVIAVIGFLFAITTAKFVCSSMILLNYLRWGKTEAWLQRWPRAAALANEIAEVGDLSDEYTWPLPAKMAQLRALCDAARERASTYRIDSPQQWYDAARLVHELGLDLRGTELGFLLRRRLEELRATLRVGAWRQKRLRDRLRPWAVVAMLSLLAWVVLR